MPTADETADKTVDKTPCQGSFKVRNANLKLGNSQSHSVNQSTCQPVTPDIHCVQWRNRMTTPLFTVTSPMSGLAGSGPDEGLSGNAHTARTEPRLGGTAPGRDKATPHVIRGNL